MPFSPLPANKMHQFLAKQRDKIVICDVRREGVPGDRSTRSLRVITREKNEIVRVYETCVSVRIVTKCNKISSQSLIS